MPANLGVDIYQEDMPMTINASTDRPSFNVSRSVSANACFLLGTAILATTVIATEFYYTALMQYLISLPRSAHMTVAEETALWAKSQFYSNCSWVLIGVMLFGIIGSIATLILVFINRRRDAVVPIRVKRLGIVLLVVSFVLGVLSLLFLAMIMPLFYELFSTFELNMPDITRLYISFSEIITNPIGIAFSSFVLAPMAVIFILKEFRIKDTVNAYLINAFVALCMLIWLVIAFIAAMQPFIEHIMVMSQ